MTSLISEHRTPGVKRAARWIGERIHAVRDGFRPHLPLYAIAFITYAAGLVESGLLGRDPDLAFAGLINGMTLLLLAGVAVCWLTVDLLRLWRSGYSGSPSAALMRSLFNDILSPARMSNGFHALIASGFLTIGFTTIKSNIPAAHPFSWDRTFMELDRTLHFGHLPHDILAPLLQHPPATLAINFFYNAWFFVAIGFFLWQGFQGKDSALRQRFLLAYFMCWILGTCLLGTIFSSAGPCFYGRLLPGPDPYAGLMAYLVETNATYPIWALHAQEQLWQSYVTHKGQVSGISAMPSMHVGTSVLFFICARAAGIRWLTWTSAIFALAIVLGSVLLAWHYAVDSYAGILIAVACWMLAGRWTRLNSRPSSGPK